MVLRTILFSLLVLFIGTVVLSDNTKETRIKVAVIDTGISSKALSELNSHLCKSGHVNLSIDSSIEDTVKHGSTMAAIIAKRIDPNKHCIMIVKFLPFDTDVTDGAVRLARGIDHAINEEADYINISIEGDSPNKLEERAIINALNKNITVVVAAGNSGRDLSDNCNVYPACYRLHDHPNFFVVGSYKNGLPSIYSNHGKQVKYNRDNNLNGYKNLGTSISTAIFTGDLVAEREKKHEHKNSSIARGLLIYRILSTETQGRR